MQNSLQLTLSCYNLAKAAAETAFKLLVAIDDFHKIFIDEVKVSKPLL